MGQVCASQVTSHKHLSVYITDTLSWGLHIDHVYTSCARKIGILKRLRWKLHPAVIHHIYTTAIQPKLEYVSLVWSGGNTTKLTKLEESFSRTGSIGISFTKLENQFAYHPLVLFFKIKLGIAPLHLRSLLPTLSSSSSGYNFRRMSYPVPAVQRSAMLQSFIPRSIILWNDLPLSIQKLTKLSSFKKHLRQHLKN